MGKLFVCDIDKGCVICVCDRDKGCGICVCDRDKRCVYVCYSNTSWREMLGRKEGHVRGGNGV